MDEYVFTADLWQWEAQTTSSWFFVTLPDGVAADLRMEAGPPRGFGSVRVEATVGASTWRTSVFPESGGTSFVLPVKKAVRVAAGIDEGDAVEVSLRLVED
ncbi:MAG TPA: DUF1905 domain-containing protein [Marmoricola sp.]|jgi:hypothetical protein|nr:DUF1905 domain-containing protein [Marmoricola sp.]